MGFLDKLQNASSSIKETSQSLLAKQAADHWDKYAHQISESILQFAEQKLTLGKSVLSDSEEYNQKVVTPLWEALPLPVRLVGRERMHWDDMMNELRVRIFFVENDTVRVHPNVKELVSEVAIGRFRVR